jgi:hypothetical protein
VAGPYALSCVGVLTQLADKTATLGTFLGWGVLCFAVALPLLVGSLLVRLKSSGPRSGRGWQFFFDLVGVVAAVAGFAMLFFNMNPWAGSAFVGTVLLACVLFVSGHH